MKCTQLFSVERYAFEMLLELILPHLPTGVPGIITLSLQMPHPCYITLLLDLDHIASGSSPASGCKSVPVTTRFHASFSCCHIEPLFWSCSDLFELFSLSRWFGLFSPIDCQWPWSLYTDCRCSQSGVVLSHGQYCHELIGKNCASGLSSTRGPFFFEGGEGWEEGCPPLEVATFDLDYISKRPSSFGSALFLCSRNWHSTHKAPSAHQRSIPHASQWCKSLGACTPWRVESTQNLLPGRQGPLGLCRAGTSECHPGSGGHHKREAGAERSTCPN